MKVKCEVWEFKGQSQWNSRYKVKLCIIGYLRREQWVGQAMVEQGGAQKQGHFLGEAIQK